MSKKSIFAPAKRIKLFDDDASQSYDHDKAVISQNPPIEAKIESWRPARLEKRVKSLRGDPLSSNQVHLSQEFRGHHIVSFEHLTDKNYARGGSGKVKKLKSLLGTSIGGVVKIMTDKRFYEKEIKYHKILGREIVFGEMNGKYYLIMPQFKVSLSQYNQQLKEFIHHQRPMSLPLFNKRQRLKSFANYLRQAEIIHNRGECLGDPKADNCMLDYDEKSSQDPTLEMIDFDGIHKPGAAERWLRTDKYLPPNLMGQSVDENYSQPDDIFIFGCMLAECFPEFFEVTYSQNRAHAPIFQILPQAKNNELAMAITDLIERMMDKTPENRPNIKFCIMMVLGLATQAKQQDFEQKESDSKSSLPEPDSKEPSKLNSYLQSLVEEKDFKKICALQKTGISLEGAFNPILKKYILSKEINSLDKSINFNYIMEILNHITDKCETLLDNEDFIKTIYQLLIDENHLLIGQLLRTQALSNAVGNLVNLSFVEMIEKNQIASAIKLRENFPEIIPYIPNRLMANFQQYAIELTERGALEQLKVLHKALPNFLNFDSYLLEKSLEKSQYSVFQWLLSTNLQWSTEKQLLLALHGFLFQTLEDNNINEFTKIIKDIPKIRDYIDAHNRKGHTLLTYAAAIGRFNFVDHLLRMPGINLEKTTQSGHDYIYFLKNHWPKPECRVQIIHSMINSGKFNPKNLFHLKDLNEEKLISQAHFEGLRELLILAEFMQFPISPTNIVYLICNDHSPQGISEVNSLIRSFLNAYEMMRKQERFQFLAGPKFSVVGKLIRRIDGERISVNSKEIEALEKGRLGTGLKLINDLSGGLVKSLYQTEASKPSLSLA